MARRSKEQEQVQVNFPYTEFMGTALWSSLDTAIADLVHNGDLQLTTATRYVVGYLAKSLTARGFEQRPTSVRRSRAKRPAQDA
jgi:hypothetical protein